MRKTVVVLGGTGMLGAMVADVLSREQLFDVIATHRTNELGSLSHLPLNWRRLDAWAASVEECRATIKGANWVVNCIGITKPLIDDDNASKVERAIRVNSQFPHTLAAAAKAENARVLQIATDCVYSGATGNYQENSAHDALDVYGKTKSLGEVPSPNVHHLRASIIGPEPKEHKFLLDWFLGQARSATLNGFINHNWNGVTTLHFAGIVRGIIHSDLSLPKLHHVVPAGRITKAGMLRAFAQSYGRGDITINEVNASSVVDRTLVTTNAALNVMLWKNGGHTAPPTIEQMIAELAKFQPRFDKSAAA